MEIFGSNIFTRNKPPHHHHEGEKQPLQYVSGNVGCALPFFPATAQRSAMCLSAVYRAVELISNSIASLPIKVFREAEQGKNEVQEHPIAYLFSDRNADGIISKFTLIKLLVQSVLIKGNGFALIERGADGTPLSLRYLEAADVLINYDKIRNTLTYDVPMLRKKIAPKDMVHLMMFSYDGVNGLSVLKHADRSLGIAQAAENAARGYYDNGGQLNGVLTVQGALSQQQRQDIRAAWGETYTAGGSGIAILQGNMSYQPIQLSAKDSQMLESREYNVTDIARFFGISPVLLGDLSKSSYSTLEAVQTDFLVHCLQPYVVMMENELSRKLLQPYETNLSVCLEENELLRTDKSAQSNYYSTLIQCGVMSINEVRKELGYNGIGEDGDKHVIPYSDIATNTINNTNTDENNGIKDKVNND